MHVSSRHWIGLHRAQVSDLLAPRAAIFSISSPVLGSVKSEISLLQQIVRTASGIGGPGDAHAQCADEFLVVADMASYDAFYKRLIEAMPLKNVTSRFAMERIKSTTALPIVVR